jgi:hypothetical protein
VPIFGRALDSMEHMIGLAHTGSHTGQECLVADSIVAAVDTVVAAYMVRRKAEIVFVAVGMIVQIVLSGDDRTT